MKCALKISCLLWFINAVSPSFFHEPSYIEIRAEHEKMGAHFGFSMGYRKKTNANVLVIGAPHHDQDGKVFVRSMDQIFANKTATSNEININMTKLAGDFTRGYSFQGQSFGTEIRVSVAYQSILDLTKAITTCAPLWTSEFKNKKNKPNGAYGTCFVVYDNNNISRYYGGYEQLNNITVDKPKFRIDSIDGGVGFSTLVDEKSNLGLISLSPIAERTDIAYFNTTSPIEAKAMNIFSKRLWRTSDYQGEIYKYLGSFVGGKFFDRNTTHYAFSARTENVYGAVGFLEVPLTKTSTWVVNKFVVRERIKMRDPIMIQDVLVGTMFGASLCAADLDSDGLSDLLVGAPAYGSDYYDAGALHIYLGGEKDTIAKRHTMIRHYKAGGRFGTALATSDVDGDGIPEIFVSAPFEDSGFGALYVLDGYEIKNILNLELSSVSLSELKMTQRIQNRNYKSFGYTLQVLSDLDDNGCNELAVGAPSSEKVLLYRCTPTIKMTVSAQLINQEYVYLQDTNFTVRLEINIEYPPKLNNINAELTTTMKAVGNGITMIGNDTFVQSLADRKSQYFKNVIFSLSNSEPGSYMFDAKVKSDLDLYLRSEAYDKSRVRISPHNSATVNLRIERRCSANMNCDPDLKSEIEWSGSKPYVLGSTPTETLTVRIHNNGFSAYQACVKIWLMGAQPLLNCTLDKDKWYQCHLPPLLKNSSHTTEIKLDMTKLTSLDRMLQWKINLFNTCGRGNFSSENSETIPFVVDTDNVIIEGLSHGRNVTDREILNMKANTSIIDDHEYTIINNGTVTWKSVIALIKVQKLNCITDYTISPTDIECSRAEIDEMYMFVCNFDLQRLSALKIKVTVYIDSELFISDLDDKKIITSSLFELHLEKNKPIIKELTTTFHYKEDVSLGQNMTLIIFFAVLLSALFFAVLISVLYKVGFFNRMVKTALEEVKHEIRKQSIQLHPLELEQILNNTPLSTVPENTEQQGERNSDSSIEKKSTTAVLPCSSTSAEITTQ